MNEHRRKPKLPRTSYNLFFEYHRREIVRALSSVGRRALGFADLARMILRLWMNATQDEKDHFAHLAEADKARYEREMEEWSIHECGP